MRNEDGDLDEHTHTEVDYDTRLAETEQAVLFDFFGLKVWIPKSQIVEDDRDGRLTIPEWLAIERGLV